MRISDWSSDVCSSDLQNVDGYLVNSSGYFLRGWSVDPTTNVVDTSSTQEVRASNLPDAPVATTVVDYAANLPSNTVDQTTSETARASCRVRVCQHLKISVVAHPLKKQTQHHYNTP